MIEPSLDEREHPSVLASLPNPSAARAHVLGNSINELPDADALKGYRPRLSIRIVAPIDM